MADTTHNVTIKATLDTSQIGISSQSAQSSSSSGGSSSYSSGIQTFSAAAAKAGASMINAGATMNKTVYLMRVAFESITLSMSELNKRIQVISWMYRNTHSTLDTTNKEFKHLTQRALALQKMSKESIVHFKALTDNLAKEINQTAETVANSEYAKINSTKRATQAQDKQTQAIQRSTQAVQQQASTFEKSITNLMKWALVSQVAGNISRNFGELADLAPTKTEETIYKWISRIGRVVVATGQGAAAGAGFGAAAGAVTGPGVLITTAKGAIIGAGAGLYGGVHAEITRAAKEKEAETNEMSDLAQSATQVAKAQEEMSKSIQNTIEKIRRDTRGDVLLETAPDQLESTLAMLEDNILRITQDISELNSRLVLGKISLNDYNTAIEDMQDKLAREKALRDELSNRYEREQDRQISEIQRQTQNFDYISELLYKQIELGKQESNSKVMRDGTWEQVLQALAEQNQLNLFEQSRSKGFFARMQDANFKQDWLAYDEAKMEFEESQRNLAFGLQLRSGLASTLQEIFKEMMTYKGLNIRDFGSLAALGGFGSTSVLGDPMLDLQREQNRLLSEMLRTIRDQDNSARYL